MHDNEVELGEGATKISADEINKKSFTPPYLEKILRVGIFPH